MDVFEVLKKEKLPVDVSYIVNKLKVNKTTVYRQLNKLISSGKVVEVNLNDGKLRYEIEGANHHHHVTCQKCHKISDIKIDESDFVQKISNDSKFKIFSHSIEFYGLCLRCQ